MGRLEELRVVDPVLTNIARGYTNSAYIGTFLAPIVPVKKEAGKIPQFGKEAFKLYNTERAIRAKSNRLSPEGRTTIDFVLTEHDIEYPIDYREAEEDIFNLQVYATQTTIDIILLRLEKEIADKVQDLNTYPANNKITLSGTSKFTNPDSDPIGVIEAGKDAIRSSIGKKPNVMVMGPATYRALKNHAKIIDRIKYSMKGVVTTDILAQIFDIPTVLVGEAIYATDNGQFSDVWQDNIVLAYVAPAPAEGVTRTPYEPSFVYTLRKEGKPETDRYDEVGGKLHIVRTTDLLTVKIVGADAGYLINDTN
jgi:hypothetical protein